MSTNPNVEKAARVVAAAESVFWSNMVTVESCWVWIGQMNNGYGRLCCGGINMMAHVFAYRRFRGDIPLGLELDHLCKNKACVNPDHLEAVTHEENVLRGTCPCADNAHKTRCVNGHELSGDNLRISMRDGKPMRVCKACRRINQNAANAKAAQAALNALEAK